MAYVDKINAGGELRNIQDTAGRQMIAPIELTSTATTAHAKGKYFIYNDTRYVATSDIAVGGTITPNTNCTAVPDGVSNEFGGEISQLKSAFNSLKGNNSFTVKDNYYIDSSGAEASSALYELYVVDIIPGKRVFGTTGNGSNGTGYLAFYNDEGTLIGDPFRNDVAEVTQFNFNVVAPNNATILKITNRKSWGVPVTVATGDVSNTIVSHYQEIKDLQKATARISGSPVTTKTENYYIDSTGAVVTGAVYDLYTVTVIPNGSVFGICGNVSNSNSYLAFYDANGNLIGEPFRNDVDGTYEFDFYKKVPGNANTLKISHRKDVSVPFSVGVGDFYSSVDYLYQLTPTIRGLTTGSVVDFTSGTSGYVSVYGNIASHETYYHTAPINVQVGDKISVTTRSVQNAIAVVSKKNQDNSYTPLVVADSNSIKTYTYTVPENMDVVISYNNDESHSGSISFAVSSESVHYLYDLLNNKIGNDASAVNYSEMFHKVGVIGDSLSSGEIAYQSGGENVYVDKYEYSWLSNMCRNCGTTAVHYSKGGMAAETWLDDFGGKRTEFENDTTCNAYFIALGTNDISQGQTLGNITDPAGTDSFVGYMREIIELVHTKAPDAVVFLVSTYATGSTSETWSSMIESISGLYQYCYYIDFIGESSIHTTSTSPYTSLGHFTTPAYVDVGNTINKLVNKIVLDNYADFMLFAVNN
jgi:hypothetical protein